jgi:hypothetical protein
MLTKSVTQAKWDKGHAIITHLVQLVVNVVDEWPKINHKDLEQKCGFLVHLATMFKDIMPYLKEFYNSMNMWNTNQGDDGYKVSDHQWWCCYLDQLICFGGWVEDVEVTGLKMPQTKMIRVTEGFGLALNTLDQLMGIEKRPKIMIRASSMIHVFYGFGDALGKGLGSGITRSDQSKLLLWICVCGYAKLIEESYNWREFTNIVEGLEEGQKGTLMNCIIFLHQQFDGQSAFYSGTLSSNKLLFKALLLVRYA